MKLSLYSFLFICTLTSFGNHIPRVNAEITTNDGSVTVTWKYEYLWNPECENTYLENGLNFAIITGQSNVTGMTLNQLEACFITGTCKHQTSTTWEEVYLGPIRQQTIAVEMEFFFGDIISLPPPLTGMLPNSVIHLLLNPPNTE